MLGITLNTKRKKNLCVVYHRGCCRRRNNVCAEETFAVFEGGL